MLGALTGILAGVAGPRRAARAVARIVSRGLSWRAHGLDRQRARDAAARQEERAMNQAMARAHREAYMAAMRGAAAVHATGPERIRNRDSHYRFRPDSDFWYLTGFPEPDAVAVL